ncbi:MAG TPA: kelch repeat-containing protein [Saprospiraceae bacterium]|nr:kelch repeat-containing protein [Saprospiraceae bacterium]
MNPIFITLFIFILSCAQTSRENNNHKVQNQSTPPKAQVESDQVTIVDSIIRIHHKLVQIVSLNTARAVHTTTLLHNGKILICGGFAGNNNYISSVEIYDPILNTFRTAGNMSVPRISHSATLLPDGKVLIAGGYDGTYLSSTEIFDPLTETFSPGTELNSPRMGHTATLLKNGKILFAGGVGTGWTFLKSAELYDIDAKSFSHTDSMFSEREAHTATLLKDGTVLISGGHVGRRANIKINTSAEIYDPVSQQFVEISHMNVKRHKHDAVLLKDGKVLITGGADETDYDGIYKSAEIYHPDLRSFTNISNMCYPRFKHNGSSVLLLDGNVLLTGGNNHGEIYNIANNSFEMIDGNMKSKHYFSSAILMQNGDVLITGGYDERTRPMNNAWIYRH